MAFHWAFSSASALIDVNSSISASVSGCVPIVEFRWLLNGSQRTADLKMHWERFQCNLKCTSKGGFGAMEMAVSRFESQFSNGARGVAVASHV